jgi:hypothetical protein
MKTIIVFLGVWTAVSLLSCQKQLSLPAVPPVIDSLPPVDSVPHIDSVHVFVVKDIWRYDYDASGIFIADSEHMSFSYDTVAFTTTMTGAHMDAVNGSFNYKDVFSFDNKQNWLKDDAYDPNNFNLLEHTYTFYRSAFGDPQRFEYSKEDYSGNPRYFTAYFQPRFLVNSNKETTIVDTSFLDYPHFSYYKVEQDAENKMIKRTFLPWSWSPFTESESYSYDASGQIKKIVDSAYGADATTSVVTTSTYVQAPAATDALDVFSKGIKGKNFWWYLQGKAYNFNLLYDNYYVGKPLQSISQTIQELQNGVVTNTTQKTYTLNNTFDADKNLSDCLLSINNKKMYRYKFAYEKRK